VDTQVGENVSEDLLADNAAAHTVGANNADDGHTICENVSEDLCSDNVD
jgi:hypothetical protein